SFRNRQCRTVGVTRGDEARLGTRTEAGVARRPFGREQLVNFQPVLAVGDVGEGGGVRRGHFDVVRVVRKVVIPQKERRFFGTFDVDDDHSLRAAGDVRVRARDVDAARVGDRYASG